VGRRRLLHQYEQLVFAAHVAIERHRREAEAVGDARHRDRLEAVGVGDLDRGLDDAVDGEAAAALPLRALAVSPQEIETGRELLHDAEYMAYTMCMAYTIEAEGLMR
jgi:hypothetical protein